MARHSSLEVDASRMESRLESTKTSGIFNGNATNTAESDICISGRNIESSRF